MRKYLLVGLAVVLLLGGALYALLRPWHCPVNRAAFERIESGMTRAEVEKLLGGPPGGYHTRPDRGFALHIPTDDEYVPGMKSEYWTGDEGDVIVTFAQSGIVSRKEFIESPPSRTGTVELIPFRLTRLKERLFP